MLNLTEDKSNSVAKDASLALINISANVDSVRKWLEPSGIIQTKCSVSIGNKLFTIEAINYNRKKLFYPKCFAKV